MQDSADVKSFGFFGFLDFWSFTFLDFWILGFWGFWIFGFLDFWIFGFLEFEIFDMCSVFLLFCVLFVCCAWLLLYICSF